MFDNVLAYAAYGSRDNLAAGKRVGVALSIMYKINVMARGNRSGSVWGLSVRDQLSGGPYTTRLDLMSREKG